MLQPTNSQGFLSKPRTQVRVGTQVSWKNLDRDFSLEPSVAGAVHLTYSTCAGLVGVDLVAIRSNGEMAVILGRRRGPAGFNFNGTLARVPLSGSEPREIFERIASADWGPDGSLAIAYHSQGKTT